MPVYKVENYIKECLDSICSQLVDDVELIIVNDGTPDNSMQIVCDVIQKNYSHLENQIKLVEQENKGLSGARNAGIPFANGKYLAFLDSDDKLKPDYIQKVLNVIDHYDVDMIQIGFIRFDDDGKEFDAGKPYAFEGFHLANQNISESIFNDALWFAWLRICKKEMYSDLEFPLGRNYEDAYLSPKLTLKAQSHYFMNDTLVMYRLNREGITFNYSDKNVEDLEWILNDMLNHAYINPIYELSFIPLSKYYLKVYLEKNGIASSFSVSKSIKQKIVKFKNKNKKSLKDSIYYANPLLYMMIIKLKTFING